jgi:hypothetical protein
VQLRIASSVDAAVCEGLSGAHDRVGQHEKYVYWEQHCMAGRVWVARDNLQDCRGREFVGTYASQLQVGKSRHAFRSC